MPRHRKDVGIVFAGELPVALRVDLLQIEDDQTGVSFISRSKAARYAGSSGPEGLPGSIQRRVHALGAGQRRRTAVRNSICRSGSPPLTVMPPFLPQ